MKELFPVVILAGGLATRLRPLTEQIPKSLILINNRPFITYQLQLLKKMQISRVVLCVGYLGEQIQEWVGDGSRFGLAVEYCFDGPTLLGTAGALRRALPLLDDNFFIMYGDSYLTSEFRPIQSQYLAQGKPALMTVFQNNNQWDKSNVEYYEEKILDYSKEKITKRMQYIDYGLGVMNRSVLENIPSNQPYDLGLLYQNLLRQNLLAGWKVDQRFYEIGSFSGIEELKNYLQ